MEQTYYFDKRGQWSGGGNAFLNNVAHAERRHSILRGGPGSIPIFPRNVPVRSARTSRKFILAPQNAWAWAPRSRGLQEFKFVTGLRVASSYYMRRAQGLLRISGSIPSAKGRPTSPVIHNVLDPTFEEALIESNQVRVPAAEGKLVSIGSGHSYRNLVNLIKGYRSYRAAGGKLDLWIAGPSGSNRARSDAMRAAEGMDGVTFGKGRLSRGECLAAFRSAAGVVLPSLVEASPLAVLEAASVNPRLVVSDITGHREILADYGSVSPQAFFDPFTPELIAEGLHRASSGLVELPHSMLSRPEVRENARDTWGKDVAAWLAEL